MSLLEPQAWACTDGHVNKHGGRCMASVPVADWIGGCGRLTTPIEHRPQLYAIWLLGGYDAYAAAWEAGLRG